MVDKLWRDEDDEYFKHIARVIRIERHRDMFKDCIDELIYQQKKIEELEKIIAKSKTQGGQK